MTEAHLKKRWTWAEFITLMGIGCVCLGLGFVPIEWHLGDGAWPLSVTVQSASGTRFRALSAEAFDDPNEARYTLKNRIPPRHSASQNPFVGGPLVVDVPTSHKTGIALLREYEDGYFQFTILVVLVEYPDGRRDGQIIDIPDLRKNRTVAAEFP